MRNNSGRCVNVDGNDVYNKYKIYGCRSNCVRGGSVSSIIAIAMIAMMRGGSVSSIITIAMIAMMEQVHGTYTSMAGWADYECSQ